MQIAYPCRRAVNLRHAHRILFLLLLFFILVPRSRTFSQTSSMIITSPYYTPDHGFSVSGTVTLGAHLANEAAVEKVEFYVDGHLVNTISRYPYSCLWTGTHSMQGLHDLEVVAYQKDGNKNSLLEVFNVEPVTTVAPVTAPVAKTKDAEGIYYKLDASGNGHADRHSEGLTLWKSTDGENWTYGGLVWSFEGDGNAAQKEWTDITKTPTRLVREAAIVYTNNNFYITGRFMPGAEPSLLVSTTGKPEGPYAPASAREAANYKASFIKLNANDLAMIRVYPNPSVQSFRLSATGVFYYTVSDISGQIITSGTAVAGTTFGSSLKAGVYFLTVITRDGQSKTFRLLKR